MAGSSPSFSPSFDPRKKLQENWSWGEMEARNLIGGLFFGHLKHKPIF